MTDEFTPYEIALEELLERLGKEHPRYRDALLYEVRLRENITSARKRGDTETRREGRAQIIQSLNDLVLDALGISFNDLAFPDEPAVEAGERVVQALPPALKPSQPFEPEMVLIPAGEFLMGSDPIRDKAADDDEQPQHTLYLPHYYLARTPVTNGQYHAFIEATCRKPPERWRGGQIPEGREDHPVVYVSWYDALVYCRWLADVTGRAYTLPSEAEWEKGARGRYGRIYPWGDEWDGGRCNTEEAGLRDTTPVGAYPEGASPYGLLDMGGNVWEWTRSLYRPYPYDPKDGREDLDAEGYRAYRGAAWTIHHWGARCACRVEPVFGELHHNLGFRVVLSPAPVLLDSGS